ncbi:hypothetical protein [Burkholderia sp. Bp8998]|uniref:hypothetical protein n=1 Tax=Burkholderia sp. Bp8998 TaxID=2184557 RepID=UPI0021AB9923|nr:hypothetical protein [Burkholderia sp. Bp8998]
MSDHDVKEYSRHPQQLPAKAGHAVAVKQGQQAKRAESNHSVAAVTEARPAAKAHTVSRAQPQPAKAHKVQSTASNGRKPYVAAKPTRMPATLPAEAMQR